ncbi:M15 family metallopeptidase [Candidatus Dojkabacteria bacterium]|nr:M15 family metallopeptidase [Candidatus Dojkabacteria bacterium]
MPKFSENSLKLLRNAHPDLQVIMNEAIKHIDFTAICTYRNQADQDQAYSEGRSKLKYPKSKHNQKPSLAVDIAFYYPTPPHIRYDDPKTASYLAGYIMMIAKTMNINLRWGGDFNMNNIASDQDFFDSAHFELI